MKLYKAMREAERLLGKRSNPSQDVLEIFEWNGGSIDIVEKLSSGASSYAYLGADGMVYLVTDINYNDTSKPWLAAYFKQVKKKPKHLPAIEFLGTTTLDGQEWYLTRMPLYQTTTPSEWAGWIEVLIKAFSDDPWGEKRSFNLIPPEYYIQIMDMFVEMEDFEGFASTYGDTDYTLYRDWSIYNMGWDKDGNIVNFDGYTSDLPIRDIKQFLT
jgi:hypothetical protein